MSVRTELLRQRDGDRCHYCSVDLIFDQAIARGNRYRDEWQRLVTIDHRTPTIRGGSDDLSNLVLACRLCNSRKGTKPYLDYRFITWAEATA